MKKISLLSFLTTITFSHQCLVTYIIKKCYPYQPQIFYKEWITCKNIEQARKFEFNLGCKKQHITINHKRFKATICPISVNTIKFTQE